MSYPQFLHWLHAFVTLLLKCSVLSYSSVVLMKSPVFQSGSSYWFGAMSEQAQSRAELVDAF